MSNDRSRATRDARETVAILEAGRYIAPGSGAVVDIREALERAVDGTVEYPPEESLRAHVMPVGSTTVEVRNETTLAAARRCSRKGLAPVALNFASAKNPGGGFLRGARAQEESLARASGIFACLEGCAMYVYHRGHSDPLYTSWAIYSPFVPVIRDDDGQLLDEPYLCSFISCAAPNAKALRTHGRSGRAVTRALEERIQRVLAIATVHEHREIVLGAWGCGVFGNDAATVAELFARALTGPFYRAFDYVCFAILDDSLDERVIDPFRDHLPSSNAD